mmetsp:Transcript_20715/g.64231  ORF Transcript_20715/g.64231 Transcript_20715/m.64231 type:complete len:221 (-) Transcript_20715:51-713(-)
MGTISPTHSLVNLAVRSLRTCVSSGRSPSAGAANTTLATASRRSSGHTFSLSRRLMRTSSSSAYSSMSSKARSSASSCSTTSTLMLALSSLPSRTISATAFFVALFASSFLFFCSRLRPTTICSCALQRVAFHDGPKSPMASFVRSEPARWRPPTTPYDLAPLCDGRHAQRCRRAGGGALGRELVVAYFLSCVSCPPPRSPASRRGAQPHGTATDIYMYM